MGRGPFDWIRRLFESDLKPSTRFVAIALVRFTKQDGTAWRSGPDLERDTGLSRRTVRYALSELREKGWLTEVDRTRHGVRVYRVAEPRGVQSVHPHGEATSAPPGVHDVHSAGAAAAPNREGRRREEDPPMPPRRGVERSLFRLLMSWTENETVPSHWRDPTHEEIAAQRSHMAQPRRQLDVVQEGLRVGQRNLGDAMRAVWCVRKGGLSERHLRFK